MPGADWMWAGFNPPTQLWLSFYPDPKRQQNFVSQFPFLLNSISYLWVQTQLVLGTDSEYRDLSKSLWVRFNPYSSPPLVT